MLLASPRCELAFYTIADSKFFLGAVALLNSLRRVGEQAPLVVVDCGLTPEQRDRLATRAVVVPPHADFHPLLQKATGPLAYPAETMIFIDADIVITRPLDPVVEEVKAGRVVAFEDIGNPRRFFAEWSSLGLGAAHRHPYVNAGFFAFTWETARDFLPLLVEQQSVVDLARTHIGDGSPSDPLFYLDQDLLNAILCTRFDGSTARLEARLAPFPPFAGVELTGSGRTLCTYADGVAPFALHHIYRKPWLAPLEPNAYSKLFTALVTDRHACLPIDSRELPLRLSNRPLARVDRWRASVQHTAHRHLRGKLHIRPRIARLRARIAA